MPGSELYNESELLHRIANGDEQAYKVLFNKYWQQMYANALRFTKQPDLAQDLTQEIFLKIWLIRHKLRSVQRFDSFLYAVAKNMILDELRRLHTIPEYVEFFDAYFQVTDENAIRKTETKDLEQCLLQAIDHLPVQMQTAFKLSRFEGLSHEQVAERMNISRVTSQNYIARAIVAIRKYLAGQQIDLTILLFLLLL